MYTIKGAHGGQVGTQVRAQVGAGPVGDQVGPEDQTRAAQTRR